MGRFPHSLLDWLGAILVLAIWFRVLAIGSGLPYSDYMMRGTCFVKQSTRFLVRVAQSPGILWGSACAPVGASLSLFPCSSFSRRPATRAQPGFLETEL